MMSLVFFNGKETRDDTLNLIKEKTGVEISVVSSSSYIYTIDVKFPDMEATKRLQSYSPNGFLGGTNLICFVDVDNRFFMCIDGNYNKFQYPYYDNMFVWVHAMICELSGELNSALTENVQSYIYECMNIIKYPINETKDTINIYPAYFSIGSSEKNPKGYIKNMYLNNERSFQPGLRFIDENNNEFITLGGYLLYYNGKHK